MIGAISLKKYIMLAVGIVDVLSCLGCSKVQNSRVPVGGSYQFTEQGAKFEKQKHNSKILFYICGSLVIIGIVFKGGAIVSGIAGGVHLAKKYQQSKDRKKAQDIDGQTEYQIEQQRYLEYLRARRERENKQKREG